MFVEQACRADGKAGPELTKFESNSKLEPLSPSLSSNPALTFNRSCFSLKSKRFCVAIESKPAKCKNAKVAVMSFRFNSFLASSWFARWARAKNATGLRVSLHIQGSTGQFTFALTMWGASFLATFLMICSSNGPKSPMSPHDPKVLSLILF